MARAGRAAGRRRPWQQESVWGVEPLDPWAMCGPDTSVTEIWRATEATGASKPVYHLVFQDQYGWYCEHGRGCPAVARVREAVRELAALMRLHSRQARARQKDTQSETQRARAGR